MKKIIKNNLLQYYVILWIIILLYNIKKYQREGLIQVKYIYWNGNE